MLYQPHAEIVDLKLPNCGDPASGVMVDTDILQQAVLDLRRSTFDTAALRAQAR